MIALVADLAVTALQPPVVKYVISVETRTWKPIEPKDVERILDNSALSPLLQRGDMNLQKSDFAGLKQGDYTLLVSGRFIEEAEDFSIYMTFGPGQKNDLPSFHVAGTESVGKRGMQEMQKIMEKLANQTASRLNQLLAPQLREAALPVVPDSVGDVGVPQLWQWPKMIAPEVPKPSQMVQTLIDPRHSDNERAGAVAGIATAAFDELAARKALERCVLRDPSPNVRIQCVQALEPVARVNVNTQRVLLYAMRNEYDDRVLGALAHVSQGFTGLSRSEAIDTWLFLMASPATPAEAVDDIANVLGKEGNVPNLDVAAASCLRQGNVVGMKKYYCADLLLRLLPPERRAAVAYDYLEHAEPMDLNDNMTMGEVMDYLTRDKLMPQGRQCDILTRLSPCAATTRACRAKRCTRRGSAKIRRPLWWTPLPITSPSSTVGGWRGRSMTSAARTSAARMSSTALTKAQDRLKKQNCTPRPHESDANKEVQDLLNRFNKPKQ